MEGVESIVVVIGFGKKDYLGKVWLYIFYVIFVGVGDYSVFLCKVLGRNKMRIGGGLIDFFFVKMCYFYVCIFFEGINLDKCYDNCIVVMIVLFFGR